MCSEEENSESTKIQVATNLKCDAIDEHDAKPNALMTMNNCVMTKHNYADDEAIE